MARNGSLGHQPGFAELHTRQAVTSLSCAHLNINPCICLLLILPCHEWIVNSLRAVVATCHLIEGSPEPRFYGNRTQWQSGAQHPICGGPIGALLLELAELELQNPPHYAVD